MRARRVTPDDALVEYLEDHGLGRVSRRLARTGVLDVVSTAIPGIRDVLGAGEGQAARAGAGSRPHRGGRTRHGPRHHLLDLGGGHGGRRPGRPSAHAGPGRGRAAVGPSKR